jgi:YfiH family protein
MQVDWAAPARVGAFVSTRAGGISAAPWDSLNLGSAVGDDPRAVAHNRALFAAQLQGAQPVFLRQVHGTRIVRLHAGALPAPDTLEADAALTTEPGIACTIQVADCLPVLLCDRAGRAVAAAHAGWRGLALGVLEATVHALCDASHAAPAELVAWLGPCIGPRRFEVGDEVRRAFGDAGARRFTAVTRRDGTPGWLADLAGLADDRLRALGLRAIARGGACTVEDGSRFFSFRRDGVTGRLGAAVWLRA